MIFKDYTQWSNRLRAESGMYLEMYRPYKSHDLNDWEGKAWYTLSKLGAERPSGILLDGPLGCGKHTALASYLVALEDSGNNIFILSRKTMPKTVAEYEVFEEYIDRLFDECIEENKPCAIVFDQVEKYEYIDDLLDLLTYYACVYKSGEYPPLFFMVISNEVLEVPSMLSELTVSYHFGNTTYKQRVRFIENRGKQLDGIVSLECLAKKLGDCTYGQLNKIISYIENKISTEYLSAISDDELEEIVKAQLQFKTKKDSLERIADELEVLLENVPELLANAGSVRNSSDSEVENSETKEVSITENQGEFVNSKRKEIVEMPPKQLALKLFGEERVNSLIESSKQLSVR